MRRWKYILAVSLCLKPFITQAAPKTPCEIPNTNQQSLRVLQEVEETDGREKLIQLVGDAKRQLGKAASPGDIACLSYAIGSAYFFLSADGADQTTHALFAVYFFMRAERNAPGSFKTKQSINRRRFAWKRAGSDADWFSTPDLKLVRLAAIPQDESLTVGPPATIQPVQICGDSEQCRAAIHWRFSPGPETALTLRKGRYELQRHGACGMSAIEVNVTGDDQLLQLPEPPPCKVSLDVRSNGQTISTFQVRLPNGNTIDADRVESEIGFVRIDAPGHGSRSVELPAKGGPLTVDLERCLVPIELKVIPPDAELTYTVNAPWGKRRIQGKRSGHGPIDEEIDVPAPEKCDTPVPHIAHVVLPRAITVQSVDAKGDALVTDKLLIDGKQVDTLAFFRPPGRYAYTASHASHGEIFGTMDVKPCFEGECPPVRLRLKFEVGQIGKLTSSKGLGPWILIIAGGVSFATGLTYGVLAVNKNEDIERYGSFATEGRSIDSLYDERDTLAAKADVFMITGGLFAAGGVLWRYLGETK